MINLKKELLEYDELYYRYQKYQSLTKDRSKVTDEVVNMLRSNGVS